MKIGLFSDSHYCNKQSTDNEKRKPLLSYDKINTAMRQFKGADMVICLGDLVDDCDNTQENIIHLKKITDLIQSYGIPFVCVMGNHDYQNFNRNEFCRHTGGIVPPLCMNLGKSTLVFLDANYNQDGSPYSRGNIKWSEACVPEEQLEALKDVLNSDKENIYVFIHQNLDPEVEKNHIVKNADEVRDLLAGSGKVRMVIQGHYHKGHTCKIQDIIYHTLPAMCEKNEDYYEILEIE